MHKQRGSAHVIVVIVLVLTLVTALGWIFYQNFIFKEPVAKETDLLVVDKNNDQAKKIQPTKSEQKTTTLAYEGSDTTIGDYRVKVPNGWSVKSGTYDKIYTATLFAGPNELKNLKYDSSKDPTIKPIDGFGWDGLTEHFYILSQEKETVDISNYSKSSFRLDSGIVGDKYTEVVERKNAQKYNVFQSKADSYTKNIYIFKKDDVVVRAYLNYYSDTGFDTQLGEKVIKSIRFH